MSQHWQALRWVWLRGTLQGRAGSWGVEVRCKVAGARPRRIWQDPVRFGFCAESSVGPLWRAVSRRVRFCSTCELTHLCCAGKKGSESAAAPRKWPRRGSAPLTWHSLCSPLTFLQVWALPAAAADVERPGRQVQQHGRRQSLRGQSGLHGRLGRVLRPRGAGIPHVSGVGARLRGSQARAAAFSQGKAEWHLWSLCGSEGETPGHAGRSRVGRCAGVAVFLDLVRNRLGVGLFAERAPEALSRLTSTRAFTRRAGTWSSTLGRSWGRSVRHPSQRGAGRSGR